MTLIPDGIFCVSNLAYILSITSSGTLFNSCRPRFLSFVTSIGIVVKSTQNILNLYSSHIFLYLFISAVLEFVASITVNSPFLILVSRILNSVFHTTPSFA
nr:MAG TPA: hypothetical protein [Caudoviricetes sp.]